MVFKIKLEIKSFIVPQFLLNSPTYSSFSQSFLFLYLEMCFAEGARVTLNLCGFVFVFYSRVLPSKTTITLVNLAILPSVSTFM